MRLNSKISIIEKNKDLADVYAEALESYGFQCETYRSSIGALECFLSHQNAPEPPELFLVDHHDPDLSGGEFALRLRDQEKLNGVPIVLMARNEQSLKEKAIKVFGCQAFLNKPFDAATLIDTVRALIYPKRGFFGSEYELELAMLMSSLFQGEFTGKLIVQNKKITKNIYFKNGQVLFVDSNHPEDSIGRLLKNHGLVTEEQILDALVIGRQEQKRIGASLIQMGIITPNQLYEFIQKQMQLMVLSCFFWKSGSFSYTPDESIPKEEIVLDMKFPILLKNAVMRAYSKERLMKRFKSLDFIPQPVANFFEHLAILELNGPEQKLCKYIDGLRPLQELVAFSDLNEEEALQLIYALLCLKVCTQSQ